MGQLNAPGGGDAATPSDAGGTPTANGTTPTANGGTPDNSGGNPGDKAGTPDDHGGGGTDDHGTGSTDPSVDGRDCTAPSGNEVMICHVPPGNPAARHTICVSLQGAIHGHGLDPNDMSAVGDHGGDTWGACQ